MENLYFVLFGVLIVAGLFTILPVSDSITLTDEGVFVEGTLNIQSNWTNYGTLDNLNTNSDIIYPDPNSQGTWTSDLQEGEKFDIVNISTVSDIRDGQINYTIRFWEDDPSLSPNETVTNTIDEVEYTDTIENISTYDYFDVTLTLREYAGSNNQRPHVDQLNVEYIQNLDRSDLGLEREMIQVLVLFTFIGTGMMALIKSI